MWLVQLNAHRFNLACHGGAPPLRALPLRDGPLLHLRHDGAQTQKYLRDGANFLYLRRSDSSPWSTDTRANPMFHADNSHAYDHWTHPEVMW